MVVTHHQSVRQDHNLVSANKSFENMAEFKYLGITVINQSCIHEEINNRWSLGNACSHSVQSMSSHLLLKNSNIKIQRTIISCYFVWV
jgi:hypothetical protein